MYIKVQIQLTGMNGFVDVEGGLLREALQADVTAERPLAGVRSHVDVQVRFARERGRALFALEWPFLNCAPRGQIGCACSCVYGENEYLYVGLS